MAFKSWMDLPHGVLEVFGTGVWIVELSRMSLNGIRVFIRAWSTSMMHVILSMWFRNLVHLNAI